MSNKELIKEIREKWFGTHVATLKQEGSLEVLEWARPDSGMYRCRYVFDGGLMYVSGDLGYAVFALTWKANVHNFDVGPYYFHGKLVALKDDRWSFNSDEAVKRLREWLKDLKARGKKYDHDEMADFFSKARECNSKDEWGFIINERYDFIQDLECDFIEWMYSCGDEIPSRVYAYLIGLQMASEQLKAKELAT